MAQGMQRNPLQSVLEAMRDRTAVSSFVGFLGLLLASAVVFELIGQPFVAAITVAFAILFAVLTLLFVVVPVSALTLLD